MNAWVVLIYMIIPPLIGIGMLGGLGGIALSYSGGILKGPVLEMMLNYSLTEATHISYCFMFGGTLLNTVFIFFESYHFLYSLESLMSSSARLLTFGSPSSSTLASPGQPTSVPAWLSSCLNFTSSFCKSSSYF